MFFLQKRGQILHNQEIFKRVYFKKTQISSWAFFHIKKCTDYLQAMLNIVCAHCLYSCSMQTLWTHNWMPLRFEIIPENKHKSSSLRDQTLVSPHNIRKKRYKLKSYTDYVSSWETKQREGRNSRYNSGNNVQTK